MGVEYVHMNANVLSPKASEPLLELELEEVVDMGMEN